MYKSILLATLPLAICVCVGYLLSAPLAAILVGLIAWVVLSDS